MSEKKRVVVYGLGNNFIFSYFELSQYYDVVALSDGSKQKWGEVYYGKKVHSIVKISDGSYDYIVITPADSEGIKEALHAQGIKCDRIISLQEALDRIPEKAWIEGKTQYSESTCDKVAFILYGGMGDILIAKNWICKLRDQYSLLPENVELFFAFGLLSDGKLIFSDMIESEKCHVITDFPRLISKGEYGITFRFCILPEVLKIHPNYIENNSGLFDYAQDLLDEGVKHYNRGFFTSENYYRTLSGYFTLKKERLYHTSFDIFGSLGAKASDRVSIPSSGIDEEKYLEGLGLLDRKYITINTGLNTEYANKNNTRAWPFDRWNQLSEEIKKTYADILVVQVGLKLTEADDIRADVHLNGVTNLSQISVILKGASIHIDYDGGLVHVNHMVGGRSIVLMGPSSVENHAYPENQYISSGLCEACEWTTPSWLSKCPKGQEHPACMAGIDVEKVMRSIADFFKS